MLDRLCGASLLILFAATAVAQTPPTSDKSPTRGAAMTRDASWDDLDTNKDGYLTKDELKGSPAWMAHFDKVDINHDGKISPEEWSARSERAKKD
jgi:hypothetical protein